VTLREAPKELRCPCGRLLARRTDDGVELKCTRCKRTVVLKWNELESQRSVLLELHE
jgi:phage FluMu protein Com